MIHETEQKRGQNSAIAIFYKITVMGLLNPYPFTGIFNQILFKNLSCESDEKKKAKRVSNCRRWKIRDKIRLEIFTPNLWQFENNQAETDPSFPLLLQRDKKNLSLVWLLIGMKKSKKGWNNFTTTAP